MMHKSKKDRFRKKGWRIGTVEDFLHLTAEEAAYVELRLRLSNSLRKYRNSRKLSQVQLARLIKSSQSRVAKMEGGDPSVSLDLLIRSLLTLGASQQDLAKTISSPMRAAT
ncbi:MAG: helix-turn-helix domain-containing protein [Nitrososphaera sp.]